MKRDQLIPLLIIFTFLIAPSFANAIDDCIGYNKETLRGIKSVGVHVVDVSSVALKHGLTAKDLKRAIEIGLNKGGIEVLPEEILMKTIGRPTIVVNVNVQTSGFDQYLLYGVRLSLFQDVTLIRNPQVKGRAPVWSVEIDEVIVEEKDIQTWVNTMIEGLVEAFIHSYYKSNPKL